MNHNYYSIITCKKYLAQCLVGNTGTREADDVMQSLQLFAISGWQKVCK